MTTPLPTPSHHHGRPGDPRPRSTAPASATSADDRPDVPLRTTLLTALEAENLALDALMATLPDTAWTLPTPAPGWTVAHQIAHLAWTDHAVLAALEPDPTALNALVEEALADPDHFTEAGAAEGAALPPDELLARWRASRAQVTHALAAAPADTRIPWLGPPMNPASMATARLMETWAHGVDIADALGRPIQSPVASATSLTWRSAPGISSTTSTASRGRRPRSASN
jgi:uncharacterized protein (TIGR03084 family)